MKIKADEYEFAFDEQNERLKINRHGEPWRTETGDGALLALMQRCEKLEEALNYARDHIAADINCGPQGLGLVCIIDDALGAGL